MITWANCHGGFIVGQAVLVLYLVPEGLKFAHPSLGPIRTNRYRLLLGAGTAGILAAFINPNTYHVFLAARLPAWMTAGNIEYQSTVSFFRYVQLPGHPGLLVPARPEPRRFGSAREAAGHHPAGPGGGNRRSSPSAQIRYMPFFMLSAVPVIEDFFCREAPERRVASSCSRRPCGRAVPAAGRPGEPEALSRGQRRQRPLLSGGCGGVHHVTRLRRETSTTSGVGRVPAVAALPGKGVLRRQELLVRRLSDERGRRGRKQRLPRQASRRGGPSSGRYGIRYAVLPMFNPRVGDVMGLLFALRTQPGLGPGLHRGQLRGLRRAVRRQPVGRAALLASREAVFRPSSSAAARN